jgi:hypothetical protein
MIPSRPEPKSQAAVGMGTVDALQAHKAPNRRDLFMMAPPIIVGHSGPMDSCCGPVIGTYCRVCRMSLMWVKWLPVESE